jgi:DNA-binding response OmpR family regulator
MGSPRVFLLDDSELVLEAIGGALRDAGMDVVAFQNVAKLAAALTESDQKLDLLLLDVQMPDANGDDVAIVAQGLRRITAPIYFLSDLAERELASRAEMAEVAGTISKGLGVAGVVACVRGILDKKAGHERRERFRAAFLESARGRIERIARALDANDAATAAHEFHALGGEASLLGFTEIATNARAGEAHAVDWRKGNSGPAATRAALDAVRRATANPV